jgi:hypothetical protein
MTKLGLVCLLAVFAADAWPAEESVPGPAASVASPVETCHVRMQAQDLQWSTYNGHVRVGTLGSDEPFVLPDPTKSTARAVDCRRNSIVPMESDWKVVAVDLPLRIFAGERVGILERDHNRARYKLRQATMTTDEHAKIGAYVERTNAHLARAPRVRRPDMSKDLDLMQLDCQDMARLVPLDPDADNRVGDWLIYGRDTNGDGKLACEEFNYTTRVIEIEDGGYSRRVRGRDGQTGSISDHHPGDTEVLKQYGESKAWFRAR